MPDMPCTAKLARLLPILGFVALSACHLDPDRYDVGQQLSSHTIDHGNWQQLNPLVENQVEPITTVHTVNFAAGETEVSEAEMTRLLEFLQNSEVHQGARIEIDGPRGEGGYFDPVTAARVAEIEAELSGIGLRSQVPDRAVTSLVRPQQAVAVSVTRAMVILPDCSAPQPELGERPAYTYSCANAAALGMMIGDPLDLERGRAAGAADGERAVLAIQRYRAGKTKSLPRSGL